MRRLSGLRYIHEARHGARGSLVQEGFAVLGIAVGVALLFASQVSSTSLTHAVAQLNGELVGSAQVQLKARGYEGVPERLLTEVRAAPGVRTASPVLERQVNLVGARGGRAAELFGIERGTFSGASVLRRFSAAQFSAVKAIALPTPFASEIGVGPYEGVRIQIGAKIIRSLARRKIARP